MLPYTLNKAADDDWGPFVAQTELRDVSDIGIGLNLSIVCSEDVERLQQATSIPDSMFGHVLRRSVFEMCSVWPSTIYLPSGSAATHNTPF